MMSKRMVIFSNLASLLKSLQSVGLITILKIPAIINMRDWLLITINQREYERSNKWFLLLNQKHISRKSVGQFWIVRMQSGFIKRLADDILFSLMIEESLSYIAIMMVLPDIIPMSYGMKKRAIRLDSEEHAIDQKGALSALFYKSEFSINSSMIS